LEEFGKAFHSQDQAELAQYEIPTIDLVIVDLYPFEETLQKGATESEIVEKIDMEVFRLFVPPPKTFKMC
jgi:phosphoribosylaminoimidazolecarboxamide formyltransferase/IMP cyclohydrolase